MNCSYRILENVHIGVRVRKTKDKKTVPYHNQPITDVYIKGWNNQGFHLEHEAFPTKDNTVWLDFDQLPLNQLKIEMGFIKNPIVFVEKILTYGGTSMVFLRADTFDYLELLDDKKQKEESEIYKLSQLKPGDRIISAICKEGNVMVYLGTFGTADIVWESYNSYNYGKEKLRCIYNTPQAAFFAYEGSNGKYTISSYPITNKVVKEFYRAADKGKGNLLIDQMFSDLDLNLEVLMDWVKNTKFDNIPWKEKPNFLEKWPQISIESYYSAPVYIQKEKKGVRENALKYIIENSSLTQNQIFLDQNSMRAMREYLKNFKY